MILNIFQAVEDRNRCGYVQMYKKMSYTVSYVTAVLCSVTDSQVVVSTPTATWLIAVSIYILFSHLIWEKEKIIKH